MKLGCHVGLKAPDYFLGSAREALSYGANACMIYTGAPQNSRRRPVSEFHVQEAWKLLEDAGWEKSSVIVHAPYIINLANSVKPETAEFGVQFLKEELQRVREIGASILVLHPGSHLKAGADTGIEWIARGLNEVLDEDTSSVQIALETMAGKGTEVGRSFEELARLRSMMHHPERVGACLDTCHIHDAGYDLSDFDSVLQEFDDVIGLDHLLVLHINDSRNVRGAAKDRHANIGQGEIGFDTLYQIVHHPALESVVKILETPYIDDKPPYADEIRMLKSGHFEDLLAD